jgi:hypothetical protein
VIGDDDWISCSLTDEELAELPDGPNPPASDADLATLAQHALVPLPPSLADYKPKDIYQQFVIGTAPLPDLAAAEYIRAELQWLAARWVKAERDMQADMVNDTRAESVRHRDANLRAASIWAIAKGDLSQRGLISRATRAINASEARAVQLGWPSVSTPHQREARDRKIAQLVKDMRRTAVPNERPFTLSTDDYHAVEMCFAFDDLDIEAEDI